ncbi:MAG: hypothetical protein U5O39_16705 [Gammaproteobacteria bacterium]|nr:hypothetical protein [Gammaproteobacteria bacterium]
MRVETGFDVDDGFDKGRVQVVAAARDFDVAQEFRLGARLEFALGEDVAGVLDGIPPGEKLVTLAIAMTRAGRSRVDRRPDRHRRRSPPAPRGRRKRSRMSGTGPPW